MTALKGARPFETLAEVTVLPIVAEMFCKRPLTPAEVAQTSVKVAELQRLYPGAAGKGCQDFLWMAETPNEWQQYTTRMKQRMLWSAHEMEELHDAAATQVVFHECDAILNSVLRKNRDQDGDVRPEQEDDSEPDHRRAE